MIFDDRPCELGEGPLWHPQREELFWFDITRSRLLSRKGAETHAWQFGENHSAAGWIDRDHLLLASETGLWRFHLADGQRDLVVSLEADMPGTRSNDGRADPWGGFWIGTMSKTAEPRAGAIYRYHEGALRQLVPYMTVSNAICFAPDRSCAYFADTWARRVMRWALCPQNGWPEGAPQVFLDLREAALNPDGAVVDTIGQLWLAQWGASRVAVYDAGGQFVKAVDFDARHTSCPAFGGAELTTLFCTSAREGLAQDVLEAEPANGMTFAVPNAGQGQAEPPVKL